MLEFKPGVKIEGVLPVVTPILIVANEAYTSLGKPCVVTSVTDGVHSENSLHYTGAAIDLRTRHLEGTETQFVVEWLRRKLTQEYDVVLESDHIHVEFDPK